MIILSLENCEVEMEYVNTPQNHAQQIEQIAREYEGEPSKGIAHGVQKDAIQNGIGARIPGKKEPDSYNGWSLKFKLFKINGKFALSFTDEGTKGLTGEIISAEEIEKKASENKLSSDQNLSRFLSVFNSGGNEGPGSFGRGKLIFQAASKSSAIICDSLRYDDGAYIAFDRKIIGTSLKQSKIPEINENAKKFIREISENTLEPLKKPGTRITILDLKEELVESIINSFKEDKPEVMNNFSLSFIKMIEETWWEIIQKFDAQISLEFDGKIKRVRLTDPLKKIFEAKDKENGYRVYTKNYVPVVIQEKEYRIKELKIVLCPDLLDDDIRGFWIQRKRMKIGYLKNIIPHHTIFKKICGYLILERSLEDEIEKSEGTTHYSFNFKHRVPSEIKQVFSNHLNRFQEELGIKNVAEETDSQQDIRNAMKEINDVARELGLISGLFSGTKSKDVEIRIESFDLPKLGSKRVDFGDFIGPVKYNVKNNSNKKHHLEFSFVAEQKGKKKKIKILYKRDIILGPKKSEDIICDPFQVTEAEFNDEEALIISAKIRDNSNNKNYKVSRKLWLGKDEVKEDNYFFVTAYAPLFPRSKSNRVEMKESIRSLRIKISNTSGMDVGINLDWGARKVQSDETSYKILKNIKSERGIILPALSDLEFAYDSIDISGEEFLAISKGPKNSKERKCEIYLEVRLSEHIPQFNMTKAQYLGKKNIPFYIGIDPPGNSIFKSAKSSDDKEDGRRSWYEGDAASGYVFVLNEGHPSYIFTTNYPQTPEIRSEYIKEQMLCQAYAIAISQGEYPEFAEEIQEQLENQEIRPEESFLKIYEIISKAMIKTNEPR